MNIPEWLLKLKVYPLKKGFKGTREKARPWNMWTLTRETEYKGCKWLCYIDGYLVVDVDHKDGLAQGLKEFRRLCPDTPNTFTVRTPHGGHHYWFKRVDEKKWKSQSPINGYKDVELKADVSTGCDQITFPLSQGYEIINDTEPINCPGWLHLVLQELKETKTTSSKPGEPITKGGRHKSMVTFAAALRYSGSSENEILAALRIRNANRCIPPLEDRDIIQIANDYGKKGVHIKTEEEPPDSCYDGYCPPETEWHDCSEDPFLKESEKIEKERNKFTLTRIGKLKLEPIEYIVEDLVPVESTGQFYGDTGTYKTFYCLAMACCIATGRPFFGKTVKKSPVLYICGEGKQGIVKRFNAWSIVNGVPVEDIEVYVSSGPRDMIDKSSVDELITTINNLVVEHIVDDIPGLIFLDTFARNFGPGDENKTSDINLYINAIDRVKEHFRCATISIHHTGLVNKDRARGGYANKCALDVEYYFEKDEDDVLRVLCTKMKDSEIPQPMAFSACGVDLGIVDKHDKKVTSLVLNNIEWTEKPQKGKEDKGRNQIVMMDILQKHEKGISVDEWRKLSKDQGVSSSCFYRNKDKWFTDKLIRVYSGLVFLGGDF